MPKTSRPLNFDAGFIGPPTPRDQTGNGCPDWQNCFLSLGKQSVEPMPGHRRTVLQSLYDGVAEDELRFIAFSPRAGGRDDGRMLAVVDGINGRVNALAHHSGGVPWTDTGGTPAPPLEVGTGLRHTNNDYPSVVSLQNRTLFTTAFDLPRLYDGQSFRRAGILPPRIKPQVVVAGADTTAVDTGAAVWTTLQGSEVTPSTSSTAPTFDGSYNQLILTEAVTSGTDSTGSLAFRDESQTISSDVDRIKIAIRNDSDLGTIPANSMQLVFDEVASLGGADTQQQNMTINVDLEPGIWTALSLEWPGTGTAFSLESVGLRLRTDLPEPILNTANTLTVQFDSIIPVETIEGNLNGTYRVAFSYYDPDRNRESFLSPFSDQVVLTAQGLDIDIAGLYEGREGGDFSFTAAVANGGNTGDGTLSGHVVGNWAPDERWILTATSTGPNATFSVLGTTSLFLDDITSGSLQENEFFQINIGDGGTAWAVDDTITFDVTGGKFLMNQKDDHIFVPRVRVYLHKTTFGTDEFGFPVFRLALEERFPFSIQGENGKATISFTNQKTEQDIIASIPYNFNSFGQIPPTQFAVADRDRIIFAGQPDYSVGEVNVVNGNHIIDIVTGAVTFSRVKPGTSNVGDGTVGTFSGVEETRSQTITLTATSTGPTATFTVVGSLSGVSATDAISASIFAVDDDAGFPDFTITDGSVAWEIGDELTFIVKSQADNTPKFGEWCEARSIRIGEDSEIYVIIKAIDSNGDGTFNHLWIGKGLNAAEPYAGTTDATNEYTLIGENNRIFFTAVTSSRGVDIESVPKLNNNQLQMGGDEIGALGIMDRSLLIIGKNSLFQAFQNASALDDLIDSPVAFPQITQVNGAPGIMAPRTFTQLPGGRAAWLGRNGKIVEASSRGGIDYHPLSENLRGFITDEGRTAQERLQFCHAFYHKQLDWYVLCIQESLSSAGVADAVQDIADDPIGIIEGGDFVTATDAFDFPVTWADETGIPLVFNFPPLTREKLMRTTEFPPWTPFQSQPLSNDHWQGTSSGGVIKDTSLISQDSLGRNFLSTGWESGALPRFLFQNDPPPNPQRGSLMDSISGHEAGFPGGVSFISNLNISKVFVGWQIDAPQAAPSFIAKNTRRAGDSWHEYPIPELGRGYYRFQFKSNNIPLTTHCFAALQAPQLGVGGGDDEVWLTQGGVVRGLFYFDAPSTKSIPANTLRFKVYEDVDDLAAGTHNFIISSAIIGGRWNSVTVTVDLTPDDATYYNDLDGMDQGAQVAFNYAAFLDLTLDAGLFNDDGNLDLYFTGGYLPFSSDSTSEVPVIQEEAFAPPCKSVGAERDSGPILVDFDRIAVVDFVKGATYIGRGWELSSTAVVSADCAASNQLPDNIIAGDIHGFSTKVMTEDAYGLGSPMSVIRWDLTGGGDNLADIDTSGTDGGLLSGLGGLVVRKVSTSGVTEDRIVLDSGINFVRVTEVWTTNPVSTDVLLIAPLDWFLRFTEIRTVDPLTLRRLKVRASYDTPRAPDVDLNLFAGADSEAIFADTSAAAVSRNGVSLRDLDFGKGELHLPQLASKALSVQIGGVKEARGRSIFGPFETSESVLGRGGIR